MLFAAIVCHEFVATWQTRSKIFFSCAAILPRIYRDLFRSFTATIFGPIAALVSATLPQT
jgi:hypothetical protein